MPNGMTIDTLFFYTCLALSAASFIYYGGCCLVSPRIKLEFRRYKLDRYRHLVGALQLIGSSGLIGGIWLPELGAAAALGLAVLMALGLLVRGRLHDTVLQMLPAWMYLAINAYLVVAFLRQ